MRGETLSSCVDSARGLQPYSSHHLCSPSPLQHATPRHATTPSRKYGPTPKISPNSPLPFVFSPRLLIARRLVRVGQSVGSHFGSDTAFLIHGSHLAWILAFSLFSSFGSMGPGFPDLSYQEHIFRHIRGAVRL